jgi:hypothetical protein
VLERNAGLGERVGPFHEDSEATAVCEVCQLSKLAHIGFDEEPGAFDPTIFALVGGRVFGDRNESATSLEDTHRTTQPLTTCGIENQIKRVHGREVHTRVVDDLVGS